VISENPLSILSSAWPIRASKRVPCRSLALAVVLSTGLGGASLAQQALQADGATTLFQNVRIFDGKSATLSASTNVLVRGNKIESISLQPIAVDRRADTRIIEGGGRTLMPGLIDNHWHAMLARTTPAQAFGDVGFNNLDAQPAQEYAHQHRRIQTIRLRPLALA
jgi:hypothetical protein